MPFRIKRYYGYVIATFIALVTPFITIGGNHIFLLSFDKKQLQLMGTAFDMQELYLMPFLLLLLFIGIFAATAIGGRAFCGWACPQTIFRVIYRDLIETKLLGLRKKINNKQKEPDYKKNAGKRIVAILIWSVLALIASANFIWYFVPPEDFFVYIQNPSEHTIVMGLLLGTAAFLIYDVVFLKEDFCIYVCPYSRVQSVLYDDNTFQAIYDPHRGGDIYDDKKDKVVFKQKDLADENNECTTCQHCVTVCPTHIDIRKGTQLECINCLECVDACTTVMGKLGKESLVQWSSVQEIHENQETKLLRKTTYMYGAAIIAIFVMLFVMGGKKENMLLNINKTTQLYKVKADNEVTNSYYMLFQNTQPKKHTFKIEIMGEYADKFVIKRFKSVTINPKKLVKELVILSTKEKLIDDKTKDTPLKIMLKAYAVDDPENIVVFREMTFFYPRADKLK
ncbi:MAG: cytochrome c oxidase accessory protein CcoG [Sulfurovaceae bacterium]|nr:cytochrome c oxidase accessory protein CcoG [Sulfurovaceae bacterium]